MIVFYAISVEVTDGHGGWESMMRVTPRQGKIIV